MRGRTVVAEAGQHVTRRQRREIAEGAQPETVEDVDQLGPVERRQRPRTEERRALAARNDNGGVLRSCEPGRERAISNADVNDTTFTERVGRERVRSLR